MPYKPRSRPAPGLEYPIFSDRGRRPHGPPPRECDPLGLPGFFRSNNSSGSFVCKRNHRMIRFAIESAAPFTIRRPPSPPSRSAPPDRPAWSSSLRSSSMAWRFGDAVPATHPPAMATTEKTGLRRGGKPKIHSNAGYAFVRTSAACPSKCRPPLAAACQGDTPWTPPEGVPPD